MYAILQMYDHVITHIIYSHIITFITLNNGSSPTLSGWELILLEPKDHPSPPILHYRFKCSEREGKNITDGFMASPAEYVSVTLPYETFLREVFTRVQIVQK